MFRP